MEQHTRRGQALSRGGILVDLHGFGCVEEVDPDGLSVLAGAGVRWRDLTSAVIAQGLVPPVLTDNLFTTVGGTASVGGVGYASYRSGTQLDNVLGMEVVIGTGDLVRCSTERNPDLVLHALGGFGQFGVITRVRHRLRPFRPVLTSTLQRFLNLRQMFVHRDGSTA